MGNLAINNSNDKELRQDNTFDYKTHNMCHNPFS